MANEEFINAPQQNHPELKSPLQLFSSTNVQPNTKHWKPFGCPVYVLNEALQQKGIHHKWKQRSKLGVYLGRSPHHAQNVALVLDRDTGLISPQFRVKYDTAFRTIRDRKVGSAWQTKAGFVAQKEPPPTLMTKRTRRNKSTSEGAMEAPKAKRQRVTFSLQPPDEVIHRVDNPIDSQIATESTATTPATQHTIVQTNAPPNTEGETGMAAEPAADPVTTRSGRQVQRPSRLIEAMTSEINAHTTYQIVGEIFCMQALSPDRNIADDHPLEVFKATADPDTMYHHQAMRQKDRREFVNAMKKEVRDQMKNGNFTIIKRSQVPKGKRVLPAVWQMKRKRDIKTRKVKKWKARLNIDGSRMIKDVDYDQTFSPVASWTSIRTLITMAIAHNWHTIQLDYVLAFPQAPVDKELYMKVPVGVTINGTPKDYALKLNKNVYGQKQSGRVWNNYLTRKLIKEVGFKQSKIDPCVFYKGKAMYVLYTDDSILAGPNRPELLKIIEDIRKAKLNITVEGDLQDFLGVNIDRKPDGTIHLTQPHLIDQIVKDLGLDDDKVTHKSTPAASSKILRAHADSKDIDGSFNKRSVIGKLNYLEQG